MMFERGWVQGVLAFSTFATFDHIWENGPSQLRCLRRLKQSTKNLLDSLSPCALRQRCCQSCQSTNRNLRWLEFKVGKLVCSFMFSSCQPLVNPIILNDNPQWSTMYRQYIFKLGWNSWSHQEKDAKCCHEKEHVSSILRFVVAHQSKQAKLLGFMQPLQPPWSVPSGELTVRNGKWPFIVDFPIKNGDFPWQNVCSPEGIDMLLIKTWKRRQGETSFDWFRQKIGLNNPYGKSQFFWLLGYPEKFVVDQWLGDFGKPFEVIYPGDGNHLSIKRNLYNKDSQDGMDEHEYHVVI